jgi:hypothetical protein
MLSPLSIAIHLIRHETNEARDDLINIQKNLSTNEFNVTLTETSGKVKYSLTGLYRARALDYVYILLKNIALDEDGYRDVQVDLPAQPQVIVSAKKMKDLYYRQHFLEAIGDGLDNLENGERVEPAPRVKKSRFSDVDQSSSQAAYTSPCCPCPHPVRKNTHLFFD